MRFHFVQFFGNIVGLCVAFKTGLIIHFSFRKIGPCIPSLASRIFENVLCRKVYILSPLIFTRSVYGRCFFFHSPAASSLYLFVCCMSRWDFSVRQITCGKVLRPIFFAVLTAFYMFYIVNCVCVSLSLFSTVVLYSTFNLSTSPREK